MFVNADGQGMWEPGQQPEAITYKTFFDLPLVDQHILWMSPDRMNTLIQNGLTLSQLGDMFNTIREGWFKQAPEEYAWRLIELLGNKMIYEHRIRTGGIES